jgi:anti-sigma B factor antagonist
MQNLLDHCVAGSGSVVLDFAKVEYISSVGLRVLMLAAKQVRTQKGKLLVAALQPVVKEIFEISRFHMVLETHPSVPQALATLSAAAAAAYGK